VFLAGCAAAMAGALLFAASESQGTVAASPAARASSLLVALAVILTLLGLVVFDSILSRSGRRLLPAAATSAYAVATLSWVIAEIHGLALHERRYGLEQIYVVGAGLSMLAIGASVVWTGVIPRWTGWAAVGWSAAGLIQFVRPHEIYPPLVPQVVPLLFGIALLRSTTPRPAAGAVDSGREDEPHASQRVFSAPDR
jgi:hypothetical protein